MNGPAIGGELAEAFARDGMVFGRQVLDPAELADATDAIESVLAGPGPLAQLAVPPRVVSGADRNGQAR